MEDSYAVLIKVFPLLNAGVLTALIGLYLRHRIAAKKLALQGRVEDRQGYGELIILLNGQVTGLLDRVEKLEEQNHKLIEGRDRDHRLILSLLNQVNRTQIGAILADMGPEGVSPEISTMFNSLMAIESGKEVP